MRLAIGLVVAALALAQTPAPSPFAAGGAGGGGSGTITSVGLVGTTNQITVTGTSPITSSGSWTLSFPTNVTLPGNTTGTFIGNLTGNASGTAGSLPTTSLLGGVTLSGLSGIAKLTAGVPSVATANTDYLPVNNAAATGTFMIGTTFSANTTTKLFGLTQANLNVTQLAAPTAVTVALAGSGAGNVDNGSHTYWATFVDSLGRETDGVSNTTAPSVTVADKTVNGKVSVTGIPVGPAGSTTNLYRSPTTFQVIRPPGQLLASLAFGTTTYTDNTADASLGADYLGLNYTGGVIYDQSNGRPIFGFSDESSSSSGSHGGAAYVAAWDGLSFIMPGLINTGAASPYLYISSYTGSDGGAYLVPDVTAGAFDALLINAKMEGQAPSGNYAYFHLTANSNLSTSSYLNQVLMGIDIDYASAGGQPFALAVYGAEDGSHFSGGFSTVGGFVGINTLTAPSETFHVTSKFADRVGQAIQAATSQTANLFQTLASDGTTVTSYIGPAGVSQKLTTVAVGSLPTCDAGAAGSRAGVTDSNAASFTLGIGAIVANGGSTKVPVYCDGTNWRIG